jgi:hypothetical protein
MECEFDVQIRSADHSGMPEVTSPDVVKVQARAAWTLCRGVTDARPTSGFHARRLLHLLLHDQHLGLHAAGLLQGTGSKTNSRAA